MDKLKTTTAFLNRHALAISIALTATAVLAWAIMYLYLRCAA